MNNSNKLLGELVAYRTYAKYLPHVGRRETLSETIDRNKQMHLNRFPQLKEEIEKAFKLVHELKVMPSMRAMQFSGTAIEKNNIRQYNCSYLAIDDVRAFGETLFLLLSGAGVGFSCQKRHVSKLPVVKVPKEEGIFFVHDSIEGWAQALDMLMEAYLLNKIRPIFNFSNVRPKGAYLVSTGAQAPGPAPLKTMLEKVESLLKVASGRRLSSLEVHDIICVVSDAVLSGGIRRAALISLFDRDDKEMLTCKSGEWWVKAPWRARANNSAVLPRAEVTKEEFETIFKACQESGAGEPGFSWSSNLDQGFNPCHEIALNSNQFCNLTTINQTGIKDKQDFLERVEAAAFLGTIQAAYTEFPYLRDSWKETTEKESLLGVSFTGVADAVGTVTSEWLEEGAQRVLDVNEKYAAVLGIPKAARATAIKPEGTSSCVLGSSSGIHARHSKYYLRRFRLTKGDALDNYLRHVIPQLVEDDLFSSTGSVVTIPQESPEGAITRENETAKDLLDRVLMYNKHWVLKGHRTGDNPHNVSATISVKPEEWDEVCKIMWENRELYSGISLLPYDGGSYQQAPFEECSKETYEKFMTFVKDIDLSKIVENSDENNLMESIACGGGACEITSL
jgi:ribonucleoside-diphosphate reductase alpha chain